MLVRLPEPRTILFVAHLDENPLTREHADQPVRQHLDQRVAPGRVQTHRANDLDLQGIDARGARGAMALDDGEPTVEARMLRIALQI